MPLEGFVSPEGSSWGPTRAGGHIPSDPKGFPCPLAALARNDVGIWRGGVRRKGTDLSPGLLGLGLIYNKEETQLMCSLHGGMCVCQGPTLMPLSPPLA